MPWPILALFSALFLGFYDISKKKSVNNNAVLPVLFIATVTGAALFFPFIMLSVWQVIPETQKMWYVAPVHFTTHIYIFIKSIIVCSSWILAYFAFKHLPVSIASPIRTSGPLWTILGALVLFGERMTWWQWVGILITLIFLQLFSRSGKKEGINFRENKWILFMYLSTIIGSISSLYDKYLMIQFPRMAVQAWYSVYLMVIMAFVMIFLWYPRRKTTTVFEWRWGIILIGIFLTLSDWVYFEALTQQGAMISVITVIRRGGVIVTFFVGGKIFNEVNLRQKAYILAGILTGIAIMIFGKYW